jgi:hypothetical protein
LIIGYLGKVTGDFNAGLGGVGILAIIMGIAFFIVGRLGAASAATLVNEAGATSANWHR